MLEQTPTVHTLADELGKLLLARSWLSTIAESCTGGSLCAALTDIPGCSAWFDRGFITYSNNAKKSILNVPESTLLKQGAVSKATALAMAEGALKASEAHVSIAITGIAGPAGGSLSKPVGTVWIAWSSPGQKTSATPDLFPGNRPAIRYQATFAALQGMIERLTATTISKPFNA